MLETDGGSASYVYIIFRKDGKGSAESLNNWYWIGEFYFVSKPLSSFDFASVEVGDSASKVAEIDPSLPMDARNLPFSVFSGTLEKDSDYFTSYKLLKDGVLILDFKAPKRDGESSADFEGFTLIRKTFYSYYGVERLFNVSVLGYPNLLQEN